MRRVDTETLAMPFHLVTNNYLIYLKEANTHKFSDIILCFFYKYLEKEDNSIFIMK